MASGVLLELKERLKDYADSINQQIRKIVIDNDYILIDMNATSQLRDRGITATGISIWDYAPYAPTTIAIKKMKGQPHDRVTLQDTGEFHASFYVDAREDEFELKANDWKSDYLERSYGKDIFGLTDENISEFSKDYVLPELLNNLKNIANVN